MTCPFCKQPADTNHNHYLHIEGFGGLDLWGSGEVVLIRKDGENTYIVELSIRDVAERLWSDMEKRIAENTAAPCTKPAIGRSCYR